MRILLYSLISVVILPLICGSLFAGDFTGQMFNLDGALLDGETITINAVNSAGVIVDTDVSDNGTFEISVLNNEVADQNQSVDLQFIRDGVVTRTVQGLFARSARNQIVDVTVPKPRRRCCCRCCRRRCYSAVNKTSSNAFAIKMPSVGETVVVESDKASLKLPGKIVTRVSRNARLTVLKTQGHWIWTTANDKGAKHSGWIKRSEVDLLPKEVEAGESVVVTQTDATLKIGSKVVAVVQKNRTLEVFNTQGDWIWTKVQTNEKEIYGWVNRKYVKRVLGSV